MADRSPGEPLNPAQLPMVQEALQGDGFFVLSQMTSVGAGAYRMDTPALLPVQLDHAQYQSSDVPFQKLSTDYKP